MKTLSEADFVQCVRALSPAKALSILGYGESVAAYRYRTLADAAPNPELKAELEEMADEETEHHQMVQSYLDKQFPNSDFVLSNEDKALVSVGTRMLDASDESTFRETIKIIQASERQTGRFYAALQQHPPMPELVPLFKEMADECFEHATRLEDLSSWHSTDNKSD